MPPIRLGLTGGIGSGKSSVGSILQKLGATLIDADAISRSLTAPQGRAIEAIVSAFGPNMVNTRTGLDRGKMRELVFTDISARSQLESIIHPLVREEMELAAQQAAVAGAQCIVFDVPLLTESSLWRSRVDKILVVDCQTSTQIERVISRDHMSRHTVENIISAQANRDARLRVADYVIFNDAIDLHALSMQVRQIAAQFGL